MFWSGRRCKQSQEARRFMARIINGQFSSAELLMESPDRDARIETRSTLNIPIVVAKYQQDSKDDPDLFTGITQDISSEGLAIMSQGPIPNGKVVVGIGVAEDWTVLQGRTLRCLGMGYGYFLSGIHISKTLPTQQFESLLEFTKSLESQGSNQLRDLATS